MKYNILIILVILLNSCNLINLGISKEKRAKLKAQKKILNLANKHNLSNADSVVFRDTIRISSVSNDTIFHYSEIEKPIVIEKERLKIRLHKVRDSIFLQGNCKGDTIYIEKNIPTQTIATNPLRVRLWGFYKWLRRNTILLLIGIALAYLIRYIMSLFGIDLGITKALRDKINSKREKKE